MKRTVFLVLISLISLFPAILIISTKGFGSFSPRWNDTIFADIGVTNTINELRGEETIPLVGKIFYNKSLFILTFIIEASKIIDTVYLSKYLLYVSLLPFWVGIYVAFSKKDNFYRLICLWLLLIILIWGLIRDPQQYLILFIPLLGILIYLGLKKLNSRALILASLVNFVINLLTFLSK